MRSGNPGYIVGKPIMAGTAVQNVLCSLFHSYNSSFQDATGAMAVLLSTRNDDWLTVPMPSASEQCNVRMKTQSVDFGIDLLTGCHIM